MIKILKRKTNKPLATADSGRKPDRKRSRAQSATSRKPRVKKQAGHSNQTAKYASRIGVPKSQNILRVIPLGGVEEVGKNMMAVEFGNDIMIIDMGFQFPEAEMLGVDYVIPDTYYLEKNKNRIKGIVITHGHMDHTGAIPYILRKLGNPRIYATKLTIGLIKQRLEEFKIDKYAKLTIIDPSQTLKLGIFNIEFFRVSHNIPDGVGLAIHTPAGIIVHTGDFKFDYTPVDQKPTDFAKLAELGKKGVLLLCSDSTDATYPGHSISESTVEETIQQIFSSTNGRIIVATFSSLISRIQQLIDAAIDHGRKVAVSGFSMEKNVELAVKLGYLKLPKQTFIKLAEIDNYPDNKIVVISTGSQGQERSALGRMSRGEHKQVKIRTGDLVVLSSSPIPGNERAIHNLMNKIIDHGAKVIYNKMLDIHASGHAYAEDLKLMLTLTKPKFFAPIHGEHYMLAAHAAIAENLGIPKENNFILKNGNILELKSNAARISKTKLPADYVMVDGLGIGDVGNVVLRDRQVMAQDGMFVIIITIDNETKKLVHSPDIISRGFIYMKGSERLIGQTKEMVKKIVNDMADDPEALSGIRSQIRDEIGLFLFKRTERRPMILPVVIKV